jgi:anthranilate phosphoribosyltransferase
MNIQTAIQTALDHRPLQPSDMRTVMRTIMSGGATPAQIGGFLIALRAKGETIDEISAAAQVMRELATKISLNEPHLIDTCGTGGDGCNTFNISTTVAFVVAAAGGKVAKHGNRSVSSRSGSADVLETAGINLNLTPEQVRQCVRKIGVGFLFAPKHHSAMKHAIGPRKELGVRTLFNLLGPLTNPAGAEHQLMGVFDEKWQEPLAHVLKNLGSKHVLVVHADDGLDEISINAPTQIVELKEGEVSRYEVTPEQFGFERAPLSTLAVAGVEESLSVLKKVLNKQSGPARDIVILNAGAAIYAADLTDSLESGIKLAVTAIDSGAALEKLEQLINLTNQFPS